MATGNTTLLGLALPVQGELAGSWGDVVNTSLTSLLDSAIAGTTTLSTDADVPLSTTPLVSNQARQAILLCTGARTALRTITAPILSKVYVVINATTGGFSVKLVGTGPTSPGVTVISGEYAVCAWNGSDFVKVSSSVLTALTGILGTGNGGTNTSASPTNGGVVYGTATAIAYSAAGTSGQILTSAGAGAPSWVTTLPIANGGTNTTTTPTNGGITYGTGTALAYSAAGTSGQILTSAGTAAPTWSAVTGTGSVVLATSPTIATATLTGVNTIQNLTVGLGPGTVATNTVVGVQAAYTNGTGSENTIVGYQAAFFNVSGVSLTAVGTQAGFSTTGNYNTFIGTYAGLTNTSGSNNTFVGQASGYLTTGGYNTFVGQGAGYTTNSGVQNSFFGYLSGYSVTTGSKNVILGSYSGSTAPISSTGSNYVVLSDGDGNVRAYWNGSIGIFNGTISPVQATTAGAPAYVKGAMYFDTTLNKMRIGGASGWETVTST